MKPGLMAPVSFLFLRQNDLVTDTLKVRPGALRLAEDKWPT